MIPLSSLSEAGSKFQAEVEKATDRSGRLLEMTIVGHFEAQDLPWPPLDPKYLKAKVNQGYSEQILIRTGTLMQNIRYHKEDWTSGFVGVLRNVLTTDGESLVNIAAVHEFGTSDGRIPARPFMAPSLEETKDEIVRNYEEAVERTFK